MSTSTGRQDSGGGLMSWQTRANLTIAGMVAAAFAAWHVALVATSTGLGVADVDRTAAALAHGRPLVIEGAATTSLPVVLVAFGAILIAALGLYTVAVFAWYGRRSRGRRGKGMATRAGVKAAAGEGRARESAKITRPGMTARQRRRAPLAEVALHIAEEASSGSPVMFTFEDHLAVIAPTGGGKSRDVMIPACLTAPGALLVTSNEVSILDAIAATRARKGRLWVFDPLERTGWPEPMVWDPVGGCQDGKRALSRGHAFAAGLAADNATSTNAGFFQRNAASALTRMLHAAALGRRGMAEVLDWAIHLENGAVEPRALIQASTDPRAEPMWAGMLASVATGADETVASSRQTLQQAVEPLALRAVMRWVTPRPGVPVFDADEFVQSSDTLVLISDDNSATNVGPLCTMVFQEVIDALKAWAPQAEHGRLDPPLRIVGDEIANVAPIERLPETVTEIRKLGAQAILAFQAPGQAQARWGEKRGDTLLEQMAAEIVLPGIKSARALQRYSDLVGMVEVAEATTGYDRDGRRTSQNSTVRERRVMRPDEIRTLPAGQALVLLRNAPAMVVALTPWFERPGGKQLAKEAAVAAGRRRAHGPHAGHGAVAGTGTPRSAIIPTGVPDDVTGALSP